MAEEQEPHPTEELQEAEDPAETPGYVPPAQKSLDEIAKLDADDESLVRYKQTLLGAAAAGVKGDGPNMEPVKMTMLTDDRDPIDINLQDLQSLTKKDTKFVIKEGIDYKIKFTFKINNEIISGLKYNHTITRKGVGVEKKTYMMGSYGPKNEEVEFTTPSDEAPKGMLFRGTYNIKSKITDDDKNIHAEWTWSIDVKKDWE